MSDLTPEEKERLSQITKEDTNSQTSKFGWDDSFQTRLVGMLLTDRYFLIQSLDKIKPNYFSKEIHVQIVSFLYSYFDKYKVLPEKWFLKEEISNIYKDRDLTIQIATLAEIEKVYDFYVPGVDVRDALVDKITYFAKVQSVKIAFHKCLERMTKEPEEEATWNYIYDQLRQTMLIDRNYEPGFEYFLNIEEMFERMKKMYEGVDTFTSGFPSIDASLTGGGLQIGNIAAWIALPGTGKCNLKGTKVIMYDGNIKNVEDVVVGDLLMGVDSKLRTVLSIHSFVDKIYKVQPVKGNPYFVNSKHILSLKNSHRTPYFNKKKKRQKNKPFHKHPSRFEQSDIYNISVEDWLKQSKHFREKMKGWRTGIDFKHKEVKIDPYVLGCWLGDGTSTNTSITNIEEEVKDAYFQEAHERNLFIFSKNNGLTFGITNNISSESIKDNSFYGDLLYYNLIKNKHIPFDYKTNSRNKRLEILAGIIDTDGYMSSNNYEIIQKSDTLADDILYLARSLGFAAYSRKSRKTYQNNFLGYYNIIQISGEISEIPVRVARKKASIRKQIKNVLLTGIDVVDTNQIGEFFGFEIDGDHLYLLDDFTVNHNSLAMCKASVENVKRGKKVLYITMEMDELGISQRFTSQWVECDINDLTSSKQKIISHVEAFKEDKLDPNMLVVKQFPGGTMDVNGIKAYYAQLVMRGFKPDLLVVDYVGEMKDDPSLQKYESAYRILRDLRAFGIEQKHCTITCVQPNSSASKLESGQYIDESNIGTSFDQFKPLDCFWSINQQPLEKDAGVARLFVIKHRNGKSRFPLWVNFDYELGTLNIDEISHDFYKQKMNLVNQKKADDVMDNKDNITKDSNSKKKQRSRIPYDPTDDTNTETLE
jgi:hypothetical protein